MELFKILLSRQIFRIIHEQCIPRQLTFLICRAIQFSSIQFISIPFYRITVKFTFFYFSFFPSSPHSNSNHINYILISILLPFFLFPFLLLVLSCSLMSILVFVSLEGVEIGFVYIDEVLSWCKKDCCILLSHCSSTKPIPM